MTVKTEQYQFYYGRKPKGIGRWLFRIGGNFDRADWFRIVGNYGDAKKEAIAEAKRQGETCITVLP